MIRLLVVALVLLEIASLILVGQAAGVLLTLLLVIGAALLGVSILRRQGGDAMRGMRSALERGQDPRPTLLKGGFRLIAALLLIVPGFAGDIVALLLLLPPVQAAAGRALARRGIRIVETQGMAFDLRTPAQPTASRDRVVDAEWEEVAPPKQPTHRPSGWTRH